MPDETIPLTITVAPNLRNLLRSIEEVFDKGMRADPVFLPLDEPSFGAIKTVAEVALGKPFPAESLPRIRLALRDFSLIVHGPYHYEISGLAYLDVCRGLNFVQAGRLNLKVAGLGAGTGTLAVNIVRP